MPQPSTQFADAATAPPFLLASANLLLTAAHRSASPFSAIARATASRIAIGGVAASLAPQRLSTLLGSCVAVCLYDPLLHAGGMNHILMPHAAVCRGCETRYGVQAMELLINDLMHLGADRRRFLAKAFGGANVLPAFTTPTIGERNAGFVRDFLQTERIPLQAESLGGDLPMEVIFETHTGRAFVRSVRRRISALVRRENAWVNSSIEQHFAPEAPVLF